MPQVSRVQHVSVPMPPGRHEEARAFYGQAIGLKEMKVPESLTGAGLDVIWFHVGDQGDEIHVFVNRNGDEPARAQHLCLQVDDVEALAQQLREHGVTVEETIAIPGRPRYFIRDPFGNQIEVMQMVPVPA